MKTKYLIIAIVAIIVVVIAIIVVMSMKKKKNQNNEPIHKDYDPSIEGLVNNTNTKENVEQVSSTIDHANETKLQEPTLNFDANPVMPQIGEATSIFEQSTTSPVTPVAESTVVEPTPVVPKETNVSEVQSVPMQTAPVTPITEQPSITEPIQVVTPVTQEPVVSQTPKFVNVGSIAEPVVDEPVIEEVKEPIVEQAPIIEPVVEPIVEEFVPEVAKTAEVQTLQNYEIKLPEEEAALEASKNMSNTQVNKAPMFVMDIPEEKPKTQVVQPEIIDIDVPDIEEIE